MSTDAAAPSSPVAPGHAGAEPGTVDVSVTTPRQHPAAAGAAGGPGRATAPARTAPHAPGGDEGSEDRRPSEARAALLRFTGVGALALAVVAVVAVAVTWTLAGRQALEETEDRTQRMADQTFAPFLQAALDDEPGALGTLRRLSDARLSDGSVLEINVWSADWVMVYSSDEDYIGVRTDPPPWAGRLLATRQPRAILTDVTGADGGPVMADVVESYAVTRVGEQDLVVEAHYDDEVVRLYQRSLLLLLLPVALVGLAVLQLAQLPLAVQLARRLESNAASRQRLLSQAVAASHVERRRIARDLHDDVIQDLAGASYAMEAIEDTVPESSQALMTRASDIVTQSVAKLRAILTELYPVDFDRVTLVAAIRELARPVQDAGATVDLDLPETAEVDRTTATLIYRVAREALANAAQHSGADHVGVLLRIRNGEAFLRVADDGRGFDTAGEQRRGHLGLYLVRDTVAEAGGVVSIASSPGVGTSVEMRLCLR